MHCLAPWPSIFYMVSLGKTSYFSLEKIKYNLSIYSGIFIIFRIYRGYSNILLNMAFISPIEVKYIWRISPVYRLLMSHGRKT